jgi:hypothetical protein
MIEVSSGRVMRRRGRMDVLEAIQREIDETLEANRIECSGVPHALAAFGRRWRSSLGAARSSVLGSGRTCRFDLRSSGSAEKAPHPAPRLSGC